ncbi:ferrous iron transport protein A [candidate division WOR-3 bacterium]|nr:ferrous iron transport protein A [candidate division WOR-3 bacterium]
MLVKTNIYTTGGKLIGKIGDLSIGEKAVIVGYEKKGEKYRQKLLSMGLTKGTVLTLLKRAPLGDPVEISVLNYKLSLRKDEADILILAGENYHE